MNWQCRFCKNSYAENPGSCLTCGARNFAYTGRVMITPVGENRITCNEMQTLKTALETAKSDGGGIFIWHRELKITAFDGTPISLEALV